LEAHAVTCDVYFWMGNTKEAVEHAELGLELYDFDTHHLSHAQEFGEDPSAILLCYLGIGQWLLGKCAEAEETIQYVKDNYDKYSHSFTRSFLLNGLAWYYVHSQNPEMALKYGRELKQLSEEKDFPPWIAVANTQVGWAQAALGETYEGIRNILTGISQWKAGGGVLTLALSYSFVIDSYIREKRYEDAEKYVNIALDHFDAVQEKHYWSELIRQKAEILFHTTDRHEEIEKLYQQAIAFTKEKELVALEKRTMESYSIFLDKYPRYK
jgi:tetratricopeptide (TPR) repeat protein